MKNEEIVFVLNTAELKEGGFEGSFNELADELEGRGATVSGNYDDDGNPVMAIYGIDVEELNSLLASYGVDNPEDYTAEEEDVEEFDFDTTNDVDDEDEYHSPEIDNDSEFEDEDDEDIEIEDDDEDIEIEDDDDEEDFESKRFSPSIRRHQKKQFKGTANLSEAVTNKIIAEVKDLAISARILESMNESIQKEKTLREYKLPLPFAGITVNGKEIIMMTESALQNTLKEAKTNYRKYYGKYKSLNESQSHDKSKYAKVLKKQSRLITILENVIALKTGKLNEEENAEDKELGDKVATLTAITFKVKDADKFIKVLTDNGIPEDVLQKVENEDDSSSDGSQENNGEQQPQDANAAAAQPQEAPAAQPAPQGGGDMGGGMGGGNPFESLTSRLTTKLNEDENPFGDTDQPATDGDVDPTNTESHDNNETGEEVRLTDTKYAPKVKEILQKVYKYKEENFDDKIGGEFVEGDEDQDGSEDSGFDEEGNQKENDAEKVGDEETIDPASVFNDIDI